MTRHERNIVFRINKSVIHLLVIIIFTTLSYCNTFDVPFLFDDTDNIVNNPAIKSFEYFKDVSRLDHPGNMDVIDKPLFKTRFIGFLTFAVNYAVHGLDVRGYHMVNLLIHICSALLLYYLIILTFRTPFFALAGEDQPYSTDSRNFIALFTALIFAVHPIQTQAVTYIVQRFASLATMLWLLSLVSYVLSRTSSTSSTNRLKCLFCFIVSLISAVLAMKTKEFALLLPLVIALYEYLFLKGSIKQRILYLTPLFLTVIVVPLSLISKADSGIGVSAAKISGAYGGITRMDYLITQVRVIVTYIRLLLFPANLRFDYDYPIFKSFFIPEIIISLLFLFSIFLISIYLYKLSRTPGRTDGPLYRLASFGFFWFFITLSAESSVFPIADLIFEHRLYLPSIGFFIALVSIIELLRQKWQLRYSLVQRLSLYSILLLVVGLSVATYSRNSLWRDKIGLMEDEVRKSPSKARPHSILGSAYAERNQMDKAIDQFNAAIACDPSFENGHYSLGVAYLGLGRLEEAAFAFKQTIALRFDHADAHSNLGYIFAKQERLDEAVREYNTAIIIFPQSEKSHNNLGNIYNKQGNSSYAINEYLTALRIKPDFAEAHYNLGNTYADLGRIEEAKSEYRTVLALKPDFIEARRKLEK